MRSLVVPVRDVVQATPRARVITLELGAVAFPFSAGQAVYAGLAEGTVRRPYSIACSPTWSAKQRALELLVQVDDHQPPDPHLERAEPGTRLRIDGPFGSFGLPTPLGEAHLLFIAGGTGIAPLRAMLWETLATGGEVSIALIYSARGPRDFAFQDELIALAADRRIDLHLTITRAGGDDWTGGRGRIDAELIRSVLRTPQTRCLVCGPPALVTDATATLRDAGVARTLLVAETFTG